MRTGDIPPHRKYAAKTKEGANMRAGPVGFDTLQAKHHKPAKTSSSYTPASQQAHQLASQQNHQLKLHTSQPASSPASQPAKPPASSYTPASQPAKMDGEEGDQREEGEDR